MGDFFFGDEERVKRFVNDPLNAQIDKSSGETPEWFRNLARKNVDAVSAANPQLVKQQSADLGRILRSITSAGERLGSDPVAAAKDWSAHNMGIFNQLVRSASGADSAAGKLMKARLGYAGRPSSSFDSVMRTGEVARSFMPVAQQLLGNAAAESQAIRGGDMSAIASLLQAAQGIPGAYESIVSSMIRPAASAHLLASGETDILSRLADAARQNFAGFEVKKSPGMLDYINAINGVTNDLIGTAGSIGGGGGGGGGGMAGLGAILGMI